ncbi:hypothetical protein N0M98_11225 [Paenibacillus doosanensis]|uniref:Uncharacterized protein n=1 Tax=Paenibacillus konkukensis TaxID=2020716 RepID=A0ABY4RWT1_9BACL|nr:MULTISPECIES: hypothetical protein [Paenibacillus]MCS7460715.1 hypothetical protein [Paenibacillus doosanensis]UQZ85897.1 hypothetical protein SK3146_05187 [Paenibacillus konkukensis]
MAMNPKQSWTDRMTGKDLIFSFIIIDLTIVTIGALSWKFGSARELIDQISFGSALSTILLAIVAMVYSYVQALEASGHNMLVQQALGRIIDKVDEFAHMKEELLALKQDTRTYNEHILESFNRFAEQASAHIDSVFEVLREQGLDVPEELEKDIAEVYRSKFNSELAAIKSRFLVSQDKRLIRELMVLIQTSFQSGYEVTLLELVDLLVYKGVEFEVRELGEVLASLEQLGIVAMADTERGRAVRIQ